VEIGVGNESSHKVSLVNAGTENIRARPRFPTKREKKSGSLGLTTLDAGYAITAHSENRLMARRPFSKATPTPSKSM